MNTCEPATENYDLPYHWLSRGDDWEVWNWSSDEQTWGCFSGDCYTIDEMVERGFVYECPCLMPVAA